MAKKQIIMGKIKYFVIVLILIIVSAGLFFAIKHTNEEQNKEPIEETEGMEVTILGGGSVQGIGGMGYVVRTKNSKLIIIDGGYESDAELVYSYIEKYGNGKVDYWFITHPHADHCNAMVELLKSDKEFQIENLCYNALSLDYYEEHDKRGFEAEKGFYDNLSNDKILNRIICKQDQIINIDNIKCDIIRIANPKLETTEGGNESSMVFKFTATDVNKSIIFLGDIYRQASEEIMQRPELLKADAVQMAHHGQNGAPKEVYDAIHPSICFFNATEALYNNDNGGGYDSGKWKSLIVQGWIQEIGAKCVKAFEGDQTYRFTRDEIFEVDN